jgi:excisionase family DNA binding protein
LSATIEAKIVFWETPVEMIETEDRRPRLSTSEVSKMFGITRATLYRWIAEGKIPEPAKDPGNGWPIWQQPELDAIVAAMRHMQTRNKKL